MADDPTTGQRPNPKWDPVSRKDLVPKITSIFDFNAEALGELKLWLEQNPPSIPLQQIIGAAQFVPTASSIVGAGTFENTSSTTYTDLPTFGPSISTLSNGKYLVIVTAGILTTIASNRACMSVSVNGSTPNDSDAAYSEITLMGRMTGWSLQTLSAGSNTITAKYKIISGSAAQGQFSDRQIFAIRYANQ